MSVWMVTGGLGFLGRHLVAALRETAGPTTRIAVVDREPPASFSGDSHHTVDLLDAEALTRLVRDLQPDRVFHLAGRTPPAAAVDLYNANCRATSTLVAALASLERPVRLLATGSAAEMGPVPDDHSPTSEDEPCLPVDPYGLSKWAASQVVLHAPAPIEPIVARVFNPIGPAMPAQLAFGRFARQLAQASPGPVELAVRDLDRQRDFIDVRDVASALVHLAAAGHPRSTYNVATGIARPVRTGLDRLIQLSGRDVRLIHEASQGSGPSMSCARIDRIHDHTGWTPRITWEQSLADLWQSLHCGCASCGSAHCRQVA